MTISHEQGRKTLSIWKTEGRRTLLPFQIEDVEIQV